MRDVCCLGSAISGPFSGRQRPPRDINSYDNDQPCKQHAGDGGACGEALGGEEACQAAGGAAEQA